MTKHKLTEFLQLGETLPIIDVRSPGEYHQGRLPNSHNMPLLSDNERADVGTIYKQVSPKAAFKKGLEYIGPKMSQFIEFAEKLKSDKLLVHCWRGGQRSQSVAQLLAAYGFQVGVLEGGYKSYRRSAIDFFKQKLPLIVLTGYTGSLKTEVLHALQKMGEQVVDLEGLAHHQGSAFGRQVSEIQPTVEQFQNLLYEDFRRMDLNHRIWVEDESMRIGGVNMTEELYFQKNEAPCVFLEIPRKTRIENLITNYGKQDEERLIKATRSIQKKLGTSQSDEAVALIRNGQAYEAADIIIKYYDRRYHKSIQNKMDHISLHLHLDTKKPKEIAERILSEL